MKKQRAFKAEWKKTKKLDLPPDKGFKILRIW